MSGRKSGRKSSHRYKKKKKTTKTMDYLRPDTAKADMRVNFYPVAAEEGKGGYIRPNNFSKTTEHLITYLYDNNRDSIGRSIRAMKYMESKFPTAPKRTKKVRSLIKSDPVKGVEQGDDPPQGEDIEDLTFEAKKDQYQAEVKIWATEKKKLTDGKFYACEIILAQCTRGMREALEMQPKFQETKEDGDAIELLRMIEACSLLTKGRGYDVKNAIEDLKDMLECTQGERESNQSYRDRLETTIHKAEQYGFSFAGAFKFKNKEDKDKYNKDEIRERTVAALLVMNSCERRYGTYKVNLHNGASKNKSDPYPKDWIEAMTELDDYIDPLKRQEIVEPSFTGSSFAQRGKAPDGSEPTPGKDKRVQRFIKCYNCHKYGHKIEQCPEASDSESSDEGEKKNVEKKKADQKPENEKPKGNSLQHFAKGDDSEYDSSSEDEQLYGSMDVMIVSKGVCLASSKKERKRSGRILYDTGSTHHIFTDKGLLRNVKTTSEPLIMETNGGDFMCMSKGIFPGVGPVWYNPEGIINVLSASKIRKTQKFQTSYYEDDESSCYLVKNKKNNKSLRFDEMEGVYLHIIEDESRKSNVNNKTNVNQYSLASLKTVVQQKELFSVRERNRAEQAGHLMRALGFPSKSDVISMITAGTIHNCPVSVRDVRNYFKIYGVLEATVKGKTVRKRPVAVREDLAAVPISKSIIGDRKNIIDASWQTCPITRSQ